MTALHAVGRALATSGAMTWEILWALILGFALSAVVQAVVRRGTIIRRLGEDRPRTLAVATGFGAASSSCSYAAVALARSLFLKGASFTAATAFEIGSTDLVVELGIILALLIGWQFTLAEFAGADQDRAARGVTPFLPAPAAPRHRPSSSRQRFAPILGGPCRSGHVHPRGGQLVASAALRAGRHLHIAHLHHGMGRSSVSGEPVPRWSAGKRASMSSSRTWPLRT